MKLCSLKCLRTCCCFCVQHGEEYGVQPCTDRRQK